MVERFFGQLFCKDSTSSRRAFPEQQHIAYCPLPVLLCACVLAEKKWWAHVLTQLVGYPSKQARFKGPHKYKALVSYMERVCLILCMEAVLAAIRPGSPADVQQSGGHRGIQPAFFMHFIQVHTKTGDLFEVCTIVLCANMVAVHFKWTAVAAATPHTQLAPSRSV